MHSTKFWIIPLLVLFQVFGNSLPIGLKKRSPHIFGPETKFKERQGEVTHYPVEDCAMVTFDEGEFSYTASSDDATVCGVYMMTKPNKMLEMKIISMDVPCDKQGLIAWVDGWELNGDYFPTASDHPKSMDDRVVEKCGKEPVEQVFVSHQNAALLQYRVPVAGKGFRIKVRHLDNPAPCNILLNEEKDVLTITNHGKAINCSFTAIFPADIKVRSISIGAENSQGAIQSGCEKSGKTDYLVIGGAPSFNHFHMEKAETICGMAAPENFHEAISCDVSIARLVSSGKSINTAVIEIQRLQSYIDYGRATLICPTKNGK